MKVVSFIAAASNSGKTTIIEKVIAVLKAKGLRVAVVKHASKGFDLDTPGKDSWKFQRAGADAVILTGPGRVAVLENTAVEPSVSELLSRAGDVDLVIFEGKKQDALNPIEVYRAGISGKQPLCMKGYPCVALVSDTALDVSIPRFDINDAQAIVEFLLRNDSLCVTAPKRDANYGC